MLTGEMKGKHEPQRLEKDRKGSASLKQPPADCDSSFYISKPTTPSTKMFHTLLRSMYLVA